MMAAGRTMPVDLQEKRQLDLGSQVARVKAHTRPWRSIIATVLALAAAVVSVAAGRRFSNWDTSGQLAPQVIALSTAAAFCVLALMAVIGFAGKSRDLMQPVTGRAHAAVVRYTVVLIGSVATLVITLGLLKVPIDQLLVGGAVTTIILGIAAQQSLSNVFSGIVLLLSHPFGVGDAVSFRSGAFSGQIEGIVVESGISYVRIETAGGVLHLPNSQVLAAAVGPVPGHPQDSTAQNSTAHDSTAHDITAPGSTAPGSASQPSPPGP
jgi:small-conductance mechanosensitive channel